MTESPSVQSGDGAAMLIIGRRIRPGCEDAYLAWEKDVLDAVARFPGYRGSDIKRPNDVQPDWVIAYKFDSVPNLRNWLNSAARQKLLDRATDFFDGPATQQILSQDNEISDPLVTVVISNRIAGDRVEAFLDWRRQMAAAESRYPGFRGSEVFRPIEGLQDEWTTIYRFDTVEHLNAWLISPERRRMLAEGGFGDFTLRTVDQSFGNWFAFDGPEAAPPSNFKTSIAVWLGLYPTVVLLTLVTAPLDMPFWLAMLTGNLLSSFVMSYLTMPYYGTRILRWWLNPAPSARQPTTNIRGFLLVLAVNAAWAAVFYLLTVKAGIGP